MKMTLQKALSVFQFDSINTVTTELIKKRYLDLAQKRHPDKGGTTDEFIELKEAYVYLKKFVSDTDTDNVSYSNFTNASEGYAKSNGNTKTKQSTPPPVNNSYQVDRDYVRELETVNNELTEQNKNYYTVLMNYESILNKEIEVFNKMNAKLTKIASDFNQSTEKNKQERDKSTEELKKQYSPAFKDLINPFQRRIDNEEYMWRQNTIIQDYEEKKQELETNFLNAMVDVYQGSYESISDILEKNT
jgi:curved DNA-binding protein CbpA